jgi:hypothetical protein
MDDDADFPRGRRDWMLPSGRLIRCREGGSAPATGVEPLYLHPLRPEDRENQQALDLFRSAPPFSLPQLFSSRFPPSMVYSLCFCGFLFVDLISMASFVILISIASSLSGFFCVCFHILILWRGYGGRVRPCPCLRWRMHLALLIYFLAL